MLYVHQYSFPYTFLAAKVALLFSSLTLEETSKRAINVKGGITLQVQHNKHNKHNNNKHKDVGVYIWR